MGGCSILTHCSTRGQTNNNFQRRQSQKEYSNGAEIIAISADTFRMICIILDHSIVQSPERLCLLLMGGYGNPPTPHFLFETSTA
jgi:hypothetical protein